MQEINKTCYRQFAARGLLARYEEGISLKIQPPSFSLLQENRMKNESDTIAATNTTTVAAGDTEKSIAISASCFFNENSNFHQYTLPRPPPKSTIKKIATGPKRHQPELYLAYTAADKKGNKNKNSEKNTIASSETAKVKFNEAIFYMDDHN